MSKPRVTNPLVLTNLETDKPNEGTQEISDGYSKTLAHLMGKSGSELNIANVDVCGKLLTGGIDRMKTPSVINTGSLVNGANVISLGGVFHYHEVMVEQASHRVSFSTNGINFIGEAYADAQLIDSGASQRHFVVRCWATCSYLQINLLDGNGNNSYRTVSYRC